MGVTQCAGDVLLSGAVARMPDAATGHLVAGERRDVSVQLGGGEFWMAASTTAGIRAGGAAAPRGAG